MKVQKLTDLAKEMGINQKVLEKTINDYNQYAVEKKDPYGRTFFKNAPSLNDSFHVALITPVVHYTMGGLLVDTDSQVLDKNSKKIQGLWASGEIMGGVHGKNRLGGNSLLDCVV